MRKFVASLIITVMLISLTAYDNKNVQDVEPIKESVVTESGGVLPITEEEGIKSEEANNENTKVKENAENITEDAATEHMEDNTMKITAGDTTFTTMLADNSSAEALKELRYSSA